MRALPAPLLHILDTIRDTLFFLDRDWRFTYLNQYALTEAGHALADLLGRTIWEQFPQLLGSPIEGHYRRAMTEQTTVHFEMQGLRSGRWFAIYAYPCPDGLMVYGQDITERKRAEEESRQSQARLRLLIEQMPVVLWSVDTDLHFTSSVGAGLAGIGLQPQQVVGMALTEFLQTDDPDFPPIVAHRRALQGEAVNFDILWQGRAFHAHVEPLTDAEGYVIGAVGAALDITERQRDEEAVRETSQTLQSLIQASPLAIVALDCADQVTIWNPAAERIFGWKAGEVLGRPLPFIPPGDEDEFRAFRTAESQGQSRNGCEVRRLRKDGTLVDISLWTAPVRDASGALRCTIGLLADITESRRAKEQQRENAERLRILSRQLLDVQELERRHLARELHDEVGQVLTGLQLNLQTGLRLEGAELRASLAEGQSLVKDLTARVRDLSLRLRPTMLDDLGLLPALLWHLERYTAQTQIHVQFEQRGLERRLHPPEVETAAYRIIQEALTNVARHAGVREARVRLWLDRDRLYLRIEDHGRGFDAPRAWNREPSSGLSGMQERAVLLGGRLTIASTPGSGTCVSAELPIQGQEERRRRGFHPRLG